MPDDLEHGWIATDREDCGEEIGYCECCGRTLYSDDYYSLLDGFYYCESCKRKMEGEEDDGEDL